MSAQYKFRPLALKGNEKPRVATSDHLCSAPGCNRYIDAGYKMIAWDTFDLHITCAEKWCTDRGIEAEYNE